MGWVNLVRECGGEGRGGGGVGREVRECGGEGRGVGRRGCWEGGQRVWRGGEGGGGREVRECGGNRTVADPGGDDHTPQQARDWTLRETVSASDTLTLP